MTETSIKQVGVLGTGKNFRRAWHDSFPFVTFQADNEKIVLRMLVMIGARQVFPRETIVRLSRFRSPLISGLRIEHTQSGWPPFVLFWSFNYRKLAQVLKELGYPILDNERNIWD